MREHLGMIDPTRLADPVLTDEQKNQLDEILSKFSDVVCTSTGKVGKTKHWIETGDSPPIRSEDSHCLETTNSRGTTTPLGTG